MGYYEKKIGLKRFCGGYTAYYYYTFRWVKDIYYTIRRKIRSIKYGFDIKDTWNVDYSLAEWLYPRLMYLKDNTNGWPNSKFETFEEWTSAIEECARKIGDYLLSQQEVWSIEADKVAYEGYKDAMFFIYENLGDLWD